MVTPRQLAPSVGKTGVGSTGPAASSITGNSPTLQSPIYFGSLGFNPHSPIALPAFADLHAGVEVSFGELRFYVNKWGTLRLTDEPRFATTAPTTSSTAEAEPALPASTSTLATSFDSDVSSDTLDEIAALSTLTTRSPSPTSSFARATEQAVAPYASSTLESLPCTHTHTQ